MTKPYIVFAGWEYYPSGGTGDIYGTYDDLESARHALAKALNVPGTNLEAEYDYHDEREWGHILDCTLAQILYIDYDTGEIKNETTPLHELIPN